MEQSTEVNKKKILESTNRIDNSSFDYNNIHKTSNPESFNKQQINIDTNNCSYNMSSDMFDSKLNDIRDSRSETIIPMDMINYDHLHHDRHHPNPHHHYDYNPDQLPTIFSSGHIPTHTTTPSTTTPTSTTPTSTTPTSTTHSTNTETNKFLYNIYNELQLLRVYLINNNNINYHKNSERTKIIHFNSNKRSHNESTYKFTLDLSYLDLNYVVKCDLLKATIPKTRQLLDDIPEQTGTHSIIFVNSNGSGVLSTATTITIDKSNYTATELQTKLRTSSILTDTIIDVEDSSTLFSSSIGSTGVTYLSDHSATRTQVIKRISCKLGYILGFIEFEHHDPFEEVYGFVNNTASNFSIMVTYEDDTTETSGILSSNTAVETLQVFLNTINSGSHNFSLQYHSNNHYYFIKNNHNQKIIKITINQDTNEEFSDIIGIHNRTIDIKSDDIYKTQTLKYILETHSDTPNHGTHASGNFQYSLISKYHIKFTDTHCVYIHIRELGSNQSNHIITKNSVKHVLGSIDLDENYQGVAFYRANEHDLSHDKFTAMSLKKITLELLDSNGKYYNSESDWSASLKITTISENQFHKKEHQELFQHYMQRQHIKTIETIKNVNI